MDLPEEAFPRLVASIQSAPTLTEETYHEMTGLSFDETEIRLKTYIRSGSYRYRTIEKPRLPTGETLELSVATEGEIDLISGMLLLVTREHCDAYAHLECAYEKLTDSPKAAAYRGYYSFKQKLYDLAAESFQEAIERRSQSPSTYICYAASVLRGENRRGGIGKRNFDREETTKLVDSLLKARALGDSRAQLYQFIGEVWLNSKITARPEDLTVLVEGLRLHPADERLGYFLARLYYTMELYEETRLLCRRFLEGTLAKSLREHFEELEELMDLIAR